MGSKINFIYVNKKSCLPKVMQFTGIAVITRLFRRRFFSGGFFFTEFVLVSFALILV